MLLHGRIEFVTNGPMLEVRGFAEGASRAVVSGVDRRM